MLYHPHPSTPTTPPPPHLPQPHPESWRVPRCFASDRSNSCRVAEGMSHVVCRKCLGAPCKSSSQVLSITIQTCFPEFRSRICSVSLPEFVPEFVLSHHPLAECIDCRSNRNCLRVPQMWDRMRDANSCLAWIFWKNFLREWGTAQNPKNALLFKCHASGVTPKQICLSVMPAAPMRAPLA